VVTYTDYVGYQPINDYRRPVVIKDVYRQAADTRDQGHQSRRPGIGRQPIPFTLQQSQKRLKLEYIKCSGSIPCLRHLRQLMNSTILPGRHGKSIGSQGCHKGRNWRKITVRTSFSSGRPRASTFTPRTRFYPRTGFYRPRTQKKIKKIKKN
jgi:hypothetical protein